MNGGLVCFLLGVVTIIGAFLFGKANGTKTTKTKISGQVIIEQQKREKAETEKDLALDTAQNVVQKTANDAAIDQYFDEFTSEVKAAKQENNVLSAIEAARKLSERAEAWRQRNNL